MSSQLEVQGVITAIELDLMQGEEQNFMLPSNPVVDKKERDMV